MCHTVSPSRCLECWRNMTGSTPSVSSSASPTLPMTLRPTTPVRLVSGWRSWRRPPPSWRGTSTRGPWTCWTRQKKGWGQKRKVWEICWITALDVYICPTQFVFRPAVQWPDEEEEDRWERQSKNLADHQGVGPEEEWGSQRGVAEGLLSHMHLCFALSSNTT